mgnify:CR=1 FL=1
MGLALALLALELYTSSTLALRSRGFGWGRIYVGLGLLRLVGQGPGGCTPRGCTVQVESWLDRANVSGGPGRHARTSGEGRFRLLYYTEY